MPHMPKDKAATNSNFSKTQRAKGSAARCKDCIAAISAHVPMLCSKCDETKALEHFDTKNKHETPANIRMCKACVQVQTFECSKCHEKKRRPEFRRQDFIKQEKHRICKSCVKADFEQPRLCVSCQTIKDRKRFNEKQWGRNGTFIQENAAKLRCTECYPIGAPLQRRGVVFYKFPSYDNRDEIIPKLTNREKTAA